METIAKLKENVLYFVDSKLNDIAGNSTSGKLFKPIINVIVRNNIDKADDILNMLANKDGKIDVMSLVEQYEDLLINGKDVTSFGIADFGDGKIKLNIPYFDKTITLDSSDIEEFKELFTN